MIIVSNSSPLINLARISKLDIVRQLYINIVIPEVVWHEVVVKKCLAGQDGEEISR